MTSTWLKVTITQEKKFSNANPYKLFTNFTILISRFCLVVRVAPISLFFIFFILYHYLHHFHYLWYFFIAFYHWMMLQILLLMSYKLACHQSQKIISNINSLYFLSNTNHIFTPSICKFFSSYELVIFVYLF